MAEFPAIHHVAVTVSDLGVSVPWYQKLIGSDPVLDEDAGDRNELEAWKQKLDDLGIDNGGIVDASYGSGVSFRDPDNVALEFFCPPG